MKPIPEFQKLSDTVFVWQDYNPDCRTVCGSTAIQTPEGLVLIDPIRLEDQTLERLRGENSIRAVLVTNGNHERDSRAEKVRLNVPVYAPEELRGNFDFDVGVRSGERLFQALQAVALPGGGAGETAYLAPGVLVVGDALIHLDALEILPEKYCCDPPQLRRSLQLLAGLSYDMACFAHGSPLLTAAKPQIDRVISSG